MVDDILVVMKTIKCNFIAGFETLKQLEKNNIIKRFTKD